MWLTVTCFIMLGDAALKAMKVKVVDAYLRHRRNMPVILNRLKLFAIIETIGELICLAWIGYGEIIFYSEENSCNWETRHSFSYIMMFLLLTFGMILIFKWALKLIEILCIIAKNIKSRY